MSGLIFLSLEEIIVIHEKMVGVGGGSTGICDITLLHAAIERPKASFAKRALYPTIWLQAAALMQSLVKNHPFIDGNKRTAFFGSMRFLSRNGWLLTATNAAVVTFALEVETKNLEVTEIAAWLKKNCKLTKNNHPSSPI